MAFFGGIVQRISAGRGFINNGADVTVATFADLPPADENDDKVAVVLTSTGVKFINKKYAGTYVSNGVDWLLIEETDGTSSSVDYNNSISGLASTTVKTAIDEIVTEDVVFSGVKEMIYRTVLTFTTDPVTNGAVTISKIDAYDGVVITLTTTGNSQTLQPPTDTTAGKKYVVINDGNSTHNINVNGYVLEPGEYNQFLWDGDSWIGDNILSSFTMNIGATGLYEGGYISIDTDTTKYIVSAGDGIIIDNSTDHEKPTINRVSWSTFSPKTPDALTTNPATFIAINASGNLVEQTIPFTAKQHRSLIIIGRLAHAQKTTIQATVPTPRLAFNQVLEATDMGILIGTISEGNNFNGELGTNNINKSVGKSFRRGSNYDVDIVSPNITDDVELTPATFAYGYRDGAGGLIVTPATTAIDGSKWDDGTGILADVPPNKFTIQRIFFYPGSNLVFIAYGQNLYNSYAGAKQALSTDSFAGVPELAEAAERTEVILRDDVTTFTDPVTDDTTYGFFQNDKFGSVTAGSSSASTTLQQAYNNSIQPQITTNSGLGSMQFKGGTGTDTDKTVEWLNNAGAITASIDGNGDAIFNSVTSDLIGNADTATALETARTIAGVSFDGTANIEIASTNLSDSSNIGRLNATQSWTGVNTFTQTIVGSISGSATQLSGKPLTSVGNRFDVIPVVDVNGVLEAGKYIDFHETDGDISDYVYRINCAAGVLNFSGAAIFNGDVRIDNSLYLGADTDVAVFESGNQLRFQTGGSTKAVIDSSGYFGIGTTSPVALLNISSSDRGIAPDTAADELLIEGLGDVGLSIFGGTVGKCNIYFGGGAGTGRGRIVFDNNIESMSFYTAASERIKIDSSGRVGINKTTPLALLHLKHTGSAFGDGLRLESSSTTNYWEQLVTTDNAFRLGLNGVTKVIVDSSGMVGINTTSPIVNLQVGDVTVDADNRVVFGKRVSSTQNNLPVIGHTSSDGGKSSIAIAATSSTGEIHFMTGNAGSGVIDHAYECMRISAIGSVYMSSTTGALVVNLLTTTQRDALTPVNGMIIYNTTTNAFNFRENGSWVTK